VYGFQPRGCRGRIVTEIMSDENQGNRQEGSGRRSPEPQFNWRGFLLLGVTLLLVVSALTINTATQRSTRITYEEFKKFVTDGKVDRNKPLELVQQDASMEQFIRGFRALERSSATVDGVSGGVPAAAAEPIPFTVSVNIELQKDEINALMAEADLVLNPKYENNVWSSMLIPLIPLVLVLGLIYFLVRQQIRTAGRGAMSFGKSRAKMLSQDRNKVTFKDVAGCDEAKEEVQELVEFLKDPKRFQKLGGKIPKGVLMVGSPGTGKTLLAKAIAGEADVPFFSISGSDFVEMFVGVGASRVRDMFEQGKKSAPCLIFIDEIDAVGRHRGHGLGGGHDEREQTLNALLVEMDGFDTQEGIIIIAATNRPDVLDPALLRPGRFDRQVTVSLPDVKGREEILRVHAKKVKLSEAADLSKIARGTPGFSGAELANLLNEAALLAARRGMKSITNSELEEARDKVRWGRERRSLALSEKEKENTAYHEAGHAILIEVLEYTEPLHKVTIIPRGPSLGSTMWLPAEDKFTLRRNEILDDLVVAMGGRVAEEIKFGDVTNGAMGDIRQATNLARKMVCAWGMSDKMGMVEYGEEEGAVFLARDISRSRNYSEATAQQIDEEVKRLIDEAYQKATDLLTTHRDKLDAIAAALREYETLDGVHIKEIMEHGRLMNPPENPQAPSAPPPLPAAVEAKPRPKQDEDGGGLPGELAGVPA